MPNKYLFIGVLYITYMFIFDSNNFRSQFKLWSEVHTLKKEKKLLERSLEEIRQQRSQLFTDEKSLEKFAREKYLMKRDDETVFVIEEVSSKR
ncbi:MAG TPA: septum formation initiator family protein [Chitinophagales bacterium]|nr:septum formation initiator family protein [Chitinophagales bacterium]